VALLTDKVVLVSGGTQGVGAGVVRAAAREGGKVVFTWCPGDPPPGLTDQFQPYLL